MSKSRAAYPAEFRQQIIELARAGKTPAQLSREFGPSAQCISNWLRRDERMRSRTPSSKETLAAGERQELERLRRELAQVKMERDILAKATAWFAARNGKTSTPSTSS